MTIFDCLKDIIKDKTGTLDQQPDFKKSWSSFMVIRYLSMDKRFREVACKANELHKKGMSSKQMYRYLIAAVPQNNRTWIRYIKKN